MVRDLRLAESTPGPLIMLTEYVGFGAAWKNAPGNSRLQAALTGVTAAVVAVIAKLGVFFAVQVLLPERGGFDAFAAFVAALSFAVLRRFAVPTYWLVPVGAVAGMGLGVLATT